MIADVDMVVVENASVRIEIDPRVFAARYIGFPGGLNFLETVSLSAEERHGTDWADPGGLTTELLPGAGQDAAVRRGPATVIEQTPLSATLLGPVSDKSDVRVKKTFQIDPAKEGTVYYTVALLAAEPGTRRLSVCNTARVPPGTTLRVTRADGMLRILAGPEAYLSAAATPTGEWEFRIPPTEDFERAVLAGFVSKVVLQREDGIWVRRILTMPADASEVPHEATFAGVLDKANAVYAVALQGAAAEVTLAEPLVFREEWTFIRDRAAGPSAGAHR